LRTYNGNEQSIHVAVFVCYSCLPVWNHDLPSYQQ
jgi:hypothetical protein